MCLAHAACRCSVSAVTRACAPDEYEFDIQIPRQLTTRTLLAGMHLALADGRSAHLTRVHHALTALPPADQDRLGITADWKTGPHQLTHR